MTAIEEIDKIIVLLNLFIETSYWPFIGFLFLLFLLAMLAWVIGHAKQ